MGSFFICKSCHQHSYLYLQKEGLSFPQPIICNVCGKTNTYLQYEVQQERYDLTCPICDGRFFIRRMPPITARCPHSHSLLHIGSDGKMIVLEPGIQPATTRGSTFTAALAGLVFGALLAEGAGALLGTVAGAVLGASADVREAQYV